MLGCEFERRIETELEKNNFEFVTHPRIGGLVPDFLVKLPGGSVAVVEAKTWAPTEENQRRAIQQAEFYKSLTGASFAFIVLPNLRQGTREKGLVNTNELIRALFERSYDFPPHTEFGRASNLRARETGVVAFYKGRKSRRRRAHRPSKARVKDRFIFAAMPFEAKYDDTFFVAIANAAAANHVVAKRLDQDDFEGDIVSEMKQLIRKSDAVVVDLSESNPNVLYEAGYAHGIDVPAIHICSTPLADLPFDVRNWNTIRYSLGRTHLLRSKLSARLKRVLFS